MKKSLGNIVVKDIKNILLFRPRLLKSLKLIMENYLKIGKLILTQLLFLIHIYLLQKLKVLNFMQKVLLQGFKIFLLDF